MLQVMESLYTNEGVKRVTLFHKARSNSSWEYFATGACSAKCFFEEVLNVLEFGPTSGYSLCSHATATLLKYRTQFQRKCD